MKVAKRRIRAIVSWSHDGAALFGRGRRFISGLEARIRGLGGVRNIVRAYRAGRL